jgi:NAD(P)-dependent dehydrogenase (short-subunit alcohol dehydrogenase family)
MAAIFITGSADGLGQLAARRLVALGHDVVLHGRNGDRAQQALRAVPGARTALEGDLASIEQTRALAQQANNAGPFQAVIHNAGVFRPNAERRETVDGLDDVFAINVLAPYLLTGVCEVVRCYMWLGQTKGPMIDGGSTVRRPCSALLPG